MDEAIELARQKKAVTGVNFVAGQRFVDDIGEFSYGEESIYSIASKFQLEVV